MQATTTGGLHFLFAIVLHVAWHVDIRLKDKCNIIVAGTYQVHHLAWYVEILYITLLPAKTKRK